MEAVLAEMPILPAMGRVFGGVHLDDDLVLVTLLHQGVHGTLKSPIQGRQASLLAEHVISQPGQHGLAGPQIMVFAQGQSEGRIDTEKVGVVEVFITSRHLVKPPPGHLHQGMPGVGRRAEIFQRLPKP
jgi:hypothetical protein